MAEALEGTDCADHNRDAAVFDCLGRPQDQRRSARLGVHCDLVLRLNPCVDGVGHLGRYQTGGSTGGDAGFVLVPHCHEIVAEVGIAYSLGQVHVAEDCREQVDELAHGMTSDDQPADVELRGPQSVDGFSVQLAAQGVLRRKRTAEFLALSGPESAVNPGA